MEAALAIAGMLYTECRTHQRPVTLPFIQSLLFYAQGWHLHFHQKPFFAAQLNLRKGINHAFPHIESLYSQIGGVVLAARPSLALADAIMIPAVVASYGAVTEDDLLDQAALDYFQVHKLYNGGAGKEDEVLKRYFAKIAEPAKLRGHRFHGLFVDEYHARKYRLVAWTPPRAATQEELDEFSALVVE